MKLSIIVAANLRGVIGRDNQLLWHLPRDLQRFKKLTLGKPVIMGRKTYESIGKPLPGRTSVVISRTAASLHEGVIVVRSLEEALEAAGNINGEEAFVIGGGEIYRLALPYAHRICLTRVHNETEGDTYFRVPETGEWREVSRESVPPDEKHAFAFEFIDYERIL